MAGGSPHYCCCCALPLLGGREGQHLDPAPFSRCEARGILLRPSRGREQPPQPTWGGRAVRLGSDKGGLRGGTRGLPASRLPGSDPPPAALRCSVSVQREELLRRLLRLQRQQQRRASLALSPAQLRSPGRGRGSARKKKISQSRPRRHHSALGW